LLVRQHRHVRPARRHHAVEVRLDAVAEMDDVRPLGAQQGDERPGARHHLLNEPPDGAGLAPQLDETAGAVVERPPHRNPPAQPARGQYEHPAARARQRSVERLLLVEEERRRVGAPVEGAHQVEKTGERSADQTGLAVLDEEDSPYHGGSPVKQDADRQRKSPAQATRLSACATPCTSASSPHSCASRMSASPPRDGDRLDPPMSHAREAASRMSRLPRIAVLAGDTPGARAVAGAVTSLLTAVGRWVEELPASADLAPYTAVILPRSRGWRAVR